MKDISDNQEEEDPRISASIRQTDAGPIMHVTTASDLAASMAVHAIAEHADSIYLDIFEGFYSKVGHSCGIPINLEEHKTQFRIVFKAAFKVGFAKGLHHVEQHSS